MTMRARFGFLPLVLLLLQLHLLAQEGPDRESAANAARSRATDAARAVERIRSELRGHDDAVRKVAAELGDAEARRVAMREARRISETRLPAVERRIRNTMRNLEGAKERAAVLEADLSKVPENTQQHSRLRQALERNRADQERYRKQLDEHNADKGELERELDQHRRAGGAGSAQDVNESARAVEMLKESLRQTEISRGEVERRLGAAVRESRRADREARQAQWAWELEQKTRALGREDVEARLAEVAAGLEDIREALADHRDRTGEAKTDIVRQLNAIDLPEDATREQYEAYRDRRAGLKRRYVELTLRGLDPDLVESLGVRREKLQEEQALLELRLAEIAKEERDLELQVARERIAVLDSMIAVSEERLLEYERSLRALHRRFEQLKEEKSVFPNVPPELRKAFDDFWGVYQTYDFVGALAKALKEASGAAARSFAAFNLALIPVEIGARFYVNLVDAMPDLENVPLVETGRGYLQYQPNTLGAHSVDTRAYGAGLVTTANELLRTAWLAKEEARKFHDLIAERQERGSER